MNQSNKRWLIIGIIAVIAIMLTPFRIIFLRALPFLAVGALMYWFGIQLWEYVQEQRFLNSIEGSIHQKLEECDSQISAIQTEKIEIEQNIEELQTKLDNARDIANSTWKESLRLINEFRQELDLRNTKIQFYKTCIKKLKALLQNHQFAKEIAEKQENLKQLRERNQDDIADLEAFKNNIELEKNYLETLDDLSFRMLGSTSLQDAKAVQKELDVINRELRDM